LESDEDTGHFLIGDIGYPHFFKMKLINKNKILKFRRMNPQEQSIYNFWILMSFIFSCLGILFIFASNFYENIFFGLILIFFGIVLILRCFKIYLNALKISGEFEFFNFDKNWKFIKNYEKIK